MRREEYFHTRRPETLQYGILPTKRTNTESEAPMAKFLVTYHGGGMPHDPELVAQAKAAFQQWLSEQGDAVVDPGDPVNMVAQVSQGTPTSPVEIGGYSIIEAPTKDDAVKLLQNHPFVKRGGTLQLNQAIGV